MYIAIMTVFVAVFGFKAVVLKSSENIYYHYVQCVIPNSTWDTLFTYYTRLYTFIFLLVGAVFAWLTRNVRSDYRESRTWTAFTCIILALVPLEATFGDKTDSQIFRYAINMELYLIIIVSALTLLFFPKIYEIYRENKPKDLNEPIETD